MKLLYTGLKARIVAKDTAKRIKHIGKWNNQAQKIKDGNMPDFLKPAVFFEFVSPLEVNVVGGGVQVFDRVQVKVHVLHEFFNDKDTGTAINLDVYDVAKDVHGWLQGYALRGADYGCSELNRIMVDEDDDHDQVYHYAATYETTWVDNSTTYPEGGYEINPPHNGQITAGQIVADVPSIVASVASLDFGSISVGASVTRSFTISGAFLPANLILSTTNGEFLITLETDYKTRIEMVPTDETIALTTVSVKFTPASAGAKTGSILYGIPDLDGEVTLTGTGL